MKRLIISGLLVTSLFCYLEWANQSAFLFQAEYALFRTSDETLHALSHPFVLFPLCGQLLLLFALVKKPKNFTLIFIGMGMIGLLVLMVLFVGILAMNFKVALSTVPFVGISVWAVIYNRRTRKKR